MFLQEVYDANSSYYHWFLFFHSFEWIICLYFLLSLEGGREGENEWMIGW